MSGDVIPSAPYRTCDICEAALFARDWSLCRACVGDPLWEPGDDDDEQA